MCAFDEGPQKAGCGSMYLFQEITVWLVVWLVYGYPDMAVSQNTLTNVTQKKNRSRQNITFGCSGFCFLFSFFSRPVIPRQANSILGILHLNCIIKRVVSDASTLYHYDLINQNNEKVSNQNMVKTVKNEN